MEVQQANREESLVTEDTGLLHLIRRCLRPTTLFYLRETYVVLSCSIGIFMIIWKWMEVWDEMDSADLEYSGNQLFNRCLFLFLAIARILASRRLDDDQLSSFLYWDTVTCICLFLFAFFDSLRRHGETLSKLLKALGLFFKVWVIDQRIKDIKAERRRRRR